MQDMQGQMNSMDYSWEFQEVESNHSGRLSYVPSQPATLPSYRSTLSREKRLPLETWNAPGLQENVFGNQFSTFYLYQKSLSRNSLFCDIKCYRIRDDEQKKVTIPMPTFARRPTMSSFVPVIFRRTLWLDSKDSKYRNFNWTNSPHHNHFYFGR